MTSIKKYYQFLNESNTYDKKWKKLKVGDYVEWIGWRLRGHIKKIEHSSLKLSDGKVLQDIAFVEFNNPALNRYIPLNWLKKVKEPKQIFSEKDPYGEEDWEE